MAGRLPRLPGVVAVVDTAGEGWFVPGGKIPNSNVSITIAADATQVLQFVLPVRFTARKIAFQIVTGQANKKIGFGVYDKDKDRILTTGALTAASSGNFNSAFLSPLTLEPGIYFMAWTTDDAGVVTRSSKILTSWNTILNLTEVRNGTANVSSAGVLPATLGTITGNTDPIPMVILLP